MEESGKNLWCDKYRPVSLNKCDFNPDQSEKLKRMIRSNDFPHLFVYGPSGSGKSTRIQCILREMFGIGANKLRIEYKTITTPSNRKIEVKIMASNYHLEVNPSDVGMYDRLVIQELIKSVAQSGSVMDSARTPFKVVVISEADKLSKDAQHALRRTSEKYVKNCRIILNAETSSRTIPALKSRCLMVRISAPSVEKITDVICSISRKENFHISRELASRVASDCERNMRRALLMVETMKARSNHEIIKPSWYLYIRDMAKKMLENQSVQNIKAMRAHFYELQTHLIPSALIFQVLIGELWPFCDDQLKGKLISLAAHYEHNTILGSKPVLHFEAFVVQFMTMYKGFLEDHLIDDSMEDTITV